MKWISSLVLVLIVTMMASCDNSTFKISADIAGMGNQQVHVVFLGDSGVTDAFIAVNEGKIKIKGNSSELTVVSFQDSQHKPLFRVAIAGGETVEITGDINTPHQYKCKGSDVAEQWMDFEREHAQLYDSPNTTPLDQAIEKFIKDNPKNPVSTLLLVADYSDNTSSKAEQLLNSIDAKARPERLISSMMQLRSSQGQPIKQLHTMMLCNDKNDFDAVVPSKTATTLIYWWAENNEGRRNDVEQMKQIAHEFGSDLQMVDVSLNTDTTGWHAIINSDAAEWQHYWAPGSILDQAVQDLQLRQLPLFIATDDQGNQIYRGADAKAARNAIAKRLGKL